MVTDILTKLGIPNVSSKKVDIYLSHDADLSFPAYICPSFESLSKQGIYVIDSKNSKSSYLPPTLLPKGVDRYSIENWLPIVKPLLKDIYTLYKHNILLGLDSTNIAFFVKDNGEISARFFGFDFSDEFSALDRSFEMQNEVNIPKLIFRFTEALQHVFYTQSEIDDAQISNDLSPEYRELLGAFKEYAPAYLQKIIQE